MKMQERKVREKRTPWDFYIGSLIDECVFLPSFNV